MENLTNERNFQSVQNMHQKEILSFREAVVYLDISDSFLYKLTSNRAITFSKPNGGKLYFKKTDLDDWMTKNELKSVRVLEDEIDNHLKNRKDGKKIN